MVQTNLSSVVSVQICHRLEFVFDFVIYFFKTRILKCKGFFSPIGTKNIYIYMILSISCGRHMTVMTIFKITVPYTFEK